MTEQNHKEPFVTEEEAREFMLDFLRKQTTAAVPSSQRYTTRYNRCGILKGAKISYALSNAIVSPRK